MDNDERYDLVRGAIFGQAIGDALGHPIEFQKTHEVNDLMDDNKFTDDTQMFCAIGEAMLDAPPHKGVEPFMEALTRRFVEWRMNPLGGSHRAPGGTCMEGVRKLGAGHHWRLSGATRDGKGNGSAMRAGIVGARYWKQPVEAFRIGCLTSVNTHNNLEAILAAGMVAFLVARMIYGDIEFAEAVAEGLELCAQYETQMGFWPCNALPITYDRNGQSPMRVVASFGRACILGMTESMGTAEFLQQNGNDFTAVPAVAEAIFYNQLFDTFEQMLLWSANNSDDSDTVTAITGTIAGAIGGCSDIPQHWMDKIELKGYLENLAKHIWEASLLDDVEAHTAVSVEEVLGEDFDEGDLGDGVVPDVIEEDYEVEF